MAPLMQPLPTLKRQRLPRPQAIVKMFTQSRIGIKKRGALQDVAYAWIVATKLEVFQFLKKTWPPRGYCKVTSAISNTQISAKAFGMPKDK